MCIRDRFSQYFAYKRYFNTIIGPWDLSRIVDNGRLYILTEYNVFWTGLARSGPVRLGPARSGPVRPGLARSGPVRTIFLIFLNFWAPWGPNRAHGAPCALLGPQGAQKLRKIKKIVRTGPDRARPGRTGPDRAGPSRTGPDRARPVQNTLYSVKI